jgi:hypothetical protein
MVKKAGALGCPDCLPVSVGLYTQRGAGSTASPLHH